jgi:hypothetical protein
MTVAGANMVGAEDETGMLDEVGVGAVDAGEVGAEVLDAAGVDADAVGAGVALPVDGMDGIEKQGAQWHVFRDS